MLVTKLIEKAAVCFSEKGLRFKEKFSLPQPFIEYLIFKFTDVMGEIKQIRKEMML